MFDDDLNNRATIKKRSSRRKANSVARVEPIPVSHDNLRRNAKAMQMANDFESENIKDGLDEIDEELNVIEDQMPEDEGTQTDHEI